MPFVNDKLVKKFYQECGEDEAKKGKHCGRVDPVLKLWHKCPVMMTDNLDVPNGKANGTRLTVEKVLLKPGETSFSVTIGEGESECKVQAVFASQVQQLVLQHEKEDINPR